MPLHRDDVGPLTIQLARLGGFNDGTLRQSFAEVGQREHCSGEGEAGIQVDCRLQLANGFIETAGKLQDDPEIHACISTTGSTLAAASRSGSRQ
jgi:hypothetical protein